MHSAELGYAERPVHRKQLYLQHVAIECDLMLLALRREGGQLVAALRNELTEASIEIETDQVVAEHGSFPLDEVFRELQEKSVNRGITDIDVLLRAEARHCRGPEQVEFLPYRVGDAISSRSLNANLLDAYRIAVAL